MGWFNIYFQPWLWELFKAQQSLTVPHIPSSHPSIPPKNVLILQNTVSWNLCIVAFCEANILLLLSLVFIFISFVWGCLWSSKPISYNFPFVATKALNLIETYHSLWLLLTHYLISEPPSNSPECCLPRPPNFRWIDGVQHKVHTALLCTMKRPSKLVKWACSEIRYNHIHHR